MPLTTSSSSSSCSSTSSNAHIKASWGHMLQWLVNSRNMMAMISQMPLLGRCSRQLGSHLGFLTLLELGLISRCKGHSHTAESSCTPRRRRLDRSHMRRWRDRCSTCRSHNFLLLQMRRCHTHRRQCSKKLTQSRPHCSSSCNFKCQCSSCVSHCRSSKCFKSSPHQHCSLRTLCSRSHVEDSDTSNQVAWGLLLRTIHSLSSDRTDRVASRINNAYRTRTWHRSVCHRKLWQVPH
mmetsp:Transcript_57958/g.135527  ORF Transcript_57958/g.135527 Transcript_57958/m.135527 type:complete len:236 (-) Transcript_57958:696-1403(-)